MPGLFSCFSCGKGGDEDNAGQVTSPKKSFLGPPLHTTTAASSIVMPETRLTNASTVMMALSEHDSGPHVFSHWQTQASSITFSRQGSHESGFLSCRESFNSTISLEHEDGMWAAGKQGHVSLELHQVHGPHQHISTHSNILHETKLASKGHHAALQSTLTRYQQQKHPCIALQELLQYCQEAGLPPADLQAVVQDLEDEQARAHLTRLVDAAASMQKCVRVVLDDTGWEVVRDDALKMMYKHVQGSTVHGFKGRCTLDHPIECVMATAREFDLSKTWNKYLLESVVMKEYSHSELLCCAVMWLPWPLHNATLVLEAVGADLLKQHGGFLITLRTPKHVDPDLLAAVPLASPKNLRIIAAPGSCIFFEPLHPLKPGGPQRTRATVELYVDAGIKHVPHMLITFVLKVMGPFLYSAALKLLDTEFADPTNPIPARIPQRPELYGLVTNHSAAYLARNPHLAADEQAGDKRHSNRKERASPRR